MLGWLRRLFGGKGNAQERYLQSPRAQRIRAKYDNAQSNNDNSDLWRYTDCLSAASANSLDVRKKLRERSRYEVANNCHARGITLTVANDLVGTGARLQILSEDEGLSNVIESAWNEWADAVGLAEKLHTFVLASVVDGEAFGVLTTNPMLETSVQLDVRLIECDMVTDPTYYGSMQTSVDGIEFDRYGNPTTYTIMRQHPGDTGYRIVGKNEYDKVSARNVLHYFRSDRAQQVRGVPETTPALHLFGQLRRYTLAVLEAAELAADYAVFISTEADPDATDPAPMAFDTTDIEKGLLTALPSGYKPFQLKAEQPTTGFDAFTKTLLREAAHAMLIPYNIATADFSEDSYAGGRMALQVYQRSMKVRRKHLMSRVLNRIFAEWLNEATRIPELLPTYIPAAASSIPHTWFFDGWGHVDPIKEANAITERLNNFTTTLAAECAEAGDDWRVVLKQRAREIDMQKKYGVLILPPGTPPLDETDGEPGSKPIKEAA